MIIFGDNNIVPYLLTDRERYFVLNFFNVANLGDRLNHLWAPDIILQTCSLESVAFDMAYANYILTNNEAFQDFMEILMGMYYSDGGDVFVLTDLNSTPVVSMVESIIKLIQQRYGYNCYIANCPEDITDIPESDMSDIGTQVFLQDKERYAHLSIDPKRIMQSTEIVGEESDKCI
jgi:hypothetical protein